MHRPTVKEKRKAFKTSMSSSLFRGRRSAFPTTIYVYAKVASFIPSAKAQELLKALEETTTADGFGGKELVAEDAVASSEDAKEPLPQLAEAEDAMATTAVEEDAMAASAVEDAIDDNGGVQGGVKGERPFAVVHTGDTVDIPRLRATAALSQADLNTLTTDLPLHYHIQNPAAQYRSVVCELEMQSISLTMNVAR